MNSKKSFPRLGSVVTLRSIARFIAGKTQEQVARDCFTSQHTVSSFERGLSSDQVLYNYYEEKFRLHELEQYQETLEVLNANK